MVAAVASSLRNRAVPAHIAVFGEIGLAGEVRTTTQAGLRAREARQLGFTRCVMPDKSLATADVPDGLEVIGVRTVGEALVALL